MRLSATLTLTLALCGVLASASATPRLVVGVFSVDETPAAPWMRRAFERGALGDEARRAEDGGDDLREAHAKLQVGERAFLEARLRSADRALSTAVRLFLRQAHALDNSEEALRAVFALIQVRAARNKQRSIPELLEPVLLAFPGFPGTQTPPPSVMEHIHSARGRLLTQLSGRLRISGRPGEIRLNGTPVGRSPLEMEGLPKSRIRVAWTPEEGQPQIREIDLARAERVHFGPAPRDLLDGLRRALREEGDARLVRLAGELRRETGAEVGCFARVRGEEIIVFRLDLERERLMGGQSARGARRPADWRALGAVCRGDRGDLSAAQARARLAEGPASASPREGGEVNLPGWITLGAGVGALGLGAIFTQSAFDSASSYNDGGAVGDKDDALSSARYADASFILSAGLIGASVYFFLRED